jgi:hypothetical protein
MRMNTDTEVIERFVKEENRRFENGWSDSKIFRKHSAWVKEISRKALPKDIPEDVVDDFYFHCLRKGLLPTVNKKTFTLLQNAYKRLMPCLDDEHTKLFRYRGTLLFGRNGDQDSEQYKKARKIISRSEKIVWANSHYSKKHLEGLSVYFDDKTMLSVIVEVFDEKVFRPDQRAHIPFVEITDLRIILILSHAQFGLEIQNELLEGNSEVIYDRNRRIQRYMEIHNVVPEHFADYLDK